MWKWHKDIEEDAAVLGGFLMWIFFFLCFLFFLFLLLLLLYGVFYLITNTAIALFRDLFPITVSINCPCHAKESSQSVEKIKGDSEPTGDGSSSVGGRRIYKYM